MSSLIFFARYFLLLRDLSHSSMVVLLALANYNNSSVFKKNIAP